MNTSEKQFVNIVTGWRLRRRGSQDRWDDAQKVLKGLAQDKGIRAQNLAAMVQKAAARRLGMQMAVEIVALVLLAAVVLGSVGYEVVRYVVPLTRATPTPTEAPSTEVPTPTPWVFTGHIYRYGTKDGLAGAEVYLDVQDGGEWQEKAMFASSESDGSFSMTLPSNLEGKEKYRLRVQLPSGWNHIEKIQSDGWTWSNAHPNTMEASFDSGEAIGAVTFEAVIQRTFTGTVYFEGEDAPESVTVELHRRDEAGNWSVAGSKNVKSPGVEAQQIPSATFTLEHESIVENEQYQISIAPLAEGNAQDWAVYAPSEMGQVESSTVVLTPGLETEVGGIVFAGPLPITLTYKTAVFEPPYDSGNPGIWRDDYVTETVMYPFATREEDKRDTPRGMKAYWPVYLAGGNLYEFWVAIPGARSSAVASYTLHSDEAGQPGVQVPGTITDVVQCRNDQPEDEWRRAATYSPEDIDPGGSFWLVVDESQARWPEECTAPNGTPYQFRLPVWKVAVRRGE